MSLTSGDADPVLIMSAVTAVTDRTTSSQAATTTGPRPHYLLSSGSMIARRPLSSMLRRIAANKRAGGLRKIKQQR